MIYTEFSEKIKLKYPAYKDIDDLELAQRIVEKYPQYKDTVTFEDVGIQEELPAGIVPITQLQKRAEDIGLAWTPSEQIKLREEIRTYKPLPTPYAKFALEAMHEPLKMSTEGWESITGIFFTNRKYYKKILGTLAPKKQESFFYHFMLNAPVDLVGSTIGEFAGGFTTPEFWAAYGTLWVVAPTVALQIARFSSKYAPKFTQAIGRMAYRMDKRAMAKTIKKIQGKLKKAKTPAQRTEILAKVFEKEITKTAPDFTWRIADYTAKNITGQWSRLASKPSIKVGEIKTIFNQLDDLIEIKRAIPTTPTPSFPNPTATADTVQKAIDLVNIGIRQATDRMSKDAQEYVREVITPAPTAPIPAEREVQPPVTPKDLVKAVKPPVVTPAKAIPVVEVPKDVKVFKKQFYWNSFKNAEKWAKENNWPTNRIIEYDRGWAIQSGVSGNYAGIGKVPKPFVDKELAREREREFLGIKAEPVKADALEVEAAKYKKVSDFIDDFIIAKGRTNEQLYGISTKKSTDTIDTLTSQYINPKTVDNWEKRIKAGEEPVIILREEGARADSVDGAHRLQAYKNLRYDKVPVVYKHQLTDIWKKAHEVDKVAVEKVDSIGVFEKDTEVKLGSMGKIKPVEFPELVNLVKDLTGTVPTITKRLRRALGMFYGVERGRIKLVPSLFTKENSEQLSKVLAHEIGHLVDYLPHKTLKRGNLLGSLQSLNHFLKNTYGLAEVTNKEFRTELKAISKFWRPWNEETAKPSFRRYRNSARELYADAISVLLNSPGMLEQKAPKFYKSFFDFLDKKPEVKTAYFDLQEVLSHDRETLIQLRRKRVREMFTNADYKSEELQKIKVEGRKVRLKDFWEQFVYGIKSINQPVYNKVGELRKQGVYISDDTNPEFLLSGRNYLSGLIKGEFKENVQPIMENLFENNIDWNTFGEFLYYERIIAGDRSEFANPRGITQKAAAELSESIKQEMGGRYKILEDNANKFRSFLKGLATEAYNEGMFTKEMFDVIKGNEKYVPFQVVEYMENYVAWKTKPQVGTLKDIGNPANALLLKVVSTIKAIETQKIRVGTFKMLEKGYPDEIQEATLQFIGKAQRPMPSKDPKLKLVTYYKDGKVRGKYVDPYIAASLEGDTIANNKAVMTILSPFRYLNQKIFRPVFVVYNPGWIPFNFIRDFLRTWKNTPGMSLYRLSKLYGKAYRPARVRIYGAKEKELDIKAEALITKLEKEKILSVTWNDLLMGQTTEDAQIEAIFEKMGLVESKREIPAISRGFEQILRMTGIRPILEWIRNTGSLVETLPKVAGYFELEGKMPPEEMRTFIRRNIGSPDFLERGYLTPATNDIFIFSNAMIQAVTADANIAVNPTTRSGFWWKTAKVTFLPTILMFIALLGGFGKKIKDMFGDVSEYDLTNYIIIPLGRDSKSGKTIYLRIPRDETSRFLAGILWKAMNALRNDQSFVKDAADIVSLFGGQLPGLTPAISAPLSTAQFLAGRNPYDSFRGRLALTREQRDAGDWYALRPFLIWQFQQVGGNIFMKTYAGERTPTKISLGEKILRSPIISNVVGRFIKISDYGAIESYRKKTDKVRQIRARKSIDENRLLNDYIEKYQKEPRSKETLFRSFRKETLRGKRITIEEDRRLRKKFNISIIKGEADPLINSLISARTNDEKVVLLTVFSEDMSNVEFIKLKDFLLKHKVISTDVLIKLKISRRKR